MIESVASLSALLAFLLAASNATSQDMDTPRLALGLGLSTGLVVGESSDFLDSGYGFKGSISYRPRSKYLWLRADVSYLNLYDDRDELTGAVADNSLLTVLVGPELTYPVGRFEPLVQASVGLSANFLSVRGSEVTEDLDETDTNFTWSLGVGIRALLAGRATPLSLELSGSLVDAGTVEFARAPAPSGPDPGSIERDVRVAVLALALRVGL